MLQIRHDLTAQSLAPKVRRMFDASAAKIRSLDRSWEPSQGSPVFTAAGRYTSRGWTEWTQGFQFGSAILQFDATGEREFLESGRRQTIGLDGAAREPHGRPRPRLQQRQHLRQPAAPDERGAHRRGRLGAPLLRTGAEMFRRGAGGALVADGRWRRLHLFLQRPALAVRGHHSLAARAGGERTSWATS